MGIEGGNGYVENTQTGAMCIIMLKNVKRGRVQGSVPHTLVVNNAIKDTLAPCLTLHHGNGVQVFSSATRFTSAPFRAILT